MALTNMHSEEMSVHLHQFISYHLFMLTTCDDSILPTGKLVNRYGHFKLAAGHVPRVECFLVSFIVGNG